MKWSWRKKGGEEEEEGRETTEGQFCWAAAARVASHPLAGLFELFAFRVDVFGLLHVVLSLVHPLLNVVHQAALRKRDTRRDSMTFSTL